MRTCRASNGRYDEGVSWKSGKRRVGHARAKHRAVTVAGGVCAVGKKEVMYHQTGT